MYRFCVCLKESKRNVASFNAPTFFGLKNVFEEIRQFVYTAVTVAF